MSSRRQYLNALQSKYIKSDKAEKTAILDEYIKNTGHNRKYVIRQLKNIRLLAAVQKPRKKRASKYKSRRKES